MVIKSIYTYLHLPFLPNSGMYNIITSRSDCTSSTSVFFMENKHVIESKKEIEINED
jgi:hypothetical protein